MRKLDMITERFSADDGNHLAVFRFGDSDSLQIHLSVDRREGGFLLLEREEAVKLRDLLTTIFPKPRPSRRPEGHVDFVGLDGETLTFRDANDGDPYREGLGVTLDLADYEYWGHLFIESDEAGRLRDLLLKLYPEKA
jgi:hypothetical protein